MSSPDLDGPTRVAVQAVRLKQENLFLLAVTKSSGPTIGDHILAGTPFYSMDDDPPCFNS